MKITRIKGLWRLTTDMGTIVYTHPNPKLTPSEAYRILPFKGANAWPTG